MSELWGLWSSGCWWCDKTGRVFFTESWAVAQAQAAEVNRPLQGCDNLAAPARLGDNGKPLTDIDKWLASMIEITQYGDETRTFIQGTDVSAPYQLEVDRDGNMVSVMWSSEPRANGRQ